MRKQPTRTKAVINNNSKNKTQMKINAQLFILYIICGSRRACENNMHEAATPQSESSWQRRAPDRYSRVLWDRWGRRPPGLPLATYKFDYTSKLRSTIDDSFYFLPIYIIISYWAATRILDNGRIVLNKYLKPLIKEDE